MSSEEPQRPEKPSSGTGRFQGRGSSSGTGQPQGTESSQGAGKSGSRWRYTDGVPPTWLRKATIILGIVAVLIALAIVGSIVLPRWWAQIVVGWVQGVSSTGILAGLGCGFLFTLLPAIGIWVAWRARWRWQVRAGVAAGSAVVALPNVLTLVIDLGATASTESARLDMVIGSPAFTGSSLAGAIVAVVGLVGSVLGWRWIRKLRTERNAATGADTARTAPKRSTKTSKEDGVQ
ncbi:MAG TPA: hypothetical protein VK086_02640 [Ruania sp.]|nr:hypothetical protein [Ruania sp.]